MSTARNKGIVCPVGNRVFRACSLVPAALPSLMAPPIWASQEQAARAAQLTHAFHQSDAAKVARASAAPSSQGRKRKRFPVRKRRPVQRRIVRHYVAEPETLKAIKSRSTWPANKPSSSYAGAYHHHNEMFARRAAARNALPPWISTATSPKRDSSAVLQHAGAFTRATAHIALAHYIEAQEVKAAGGLTGAPATSGEMPSPDWAAGPQNAFGSTNAALALFYQMQMSITAQMQHYMQMMAVGAVPPGATLPPGFPAPMAAAMGLSVPPADAPASATLTSAPATTPSASAFSQTGATAEGAKPTDMDTE
ncbi:uncharacterized protein AMSG_09170 [Thecamonas trahens ATCC 50062]|uniref:Uncharacterized protein n=1 Tax=Thecamonas trahens ATCC 50062 TaxID=461836 RepID=A0A0L0DNJ4_THETB|nr:hypothetical protein AMSG_09170 [Thecamonas trahens ATCC 50062]KNC52993.1 hypothetical protein AMSG_09170 [Thecamonas trahens ATCC 50062]|eukprot:XP_013754880.1 hypothetical protein AMSG_09170 [Thecamonas trahens ATCC 50062]